MEFNEKLQELRKNKNLTQEQLAEMLFVSRTAISKWESGRGYPSIDSLKEISKQVNDIIDFFNFHKDDLKDNIDYCSIIEEAEDITSDLYSKVTNVNDRNIELPIKITFLKTYCISSNIKDNDIIRVLTWIVLKLSVIYHCLPKQTINCSR